MTRHVDTNDYWWDRTRVHVPITTTRDVTFECGDATGHMAPREAWVFDMWRRHRVRHRAASRRVHPVDTVGRETFWRLVDHADREPRVVAFDPGSRPSLDVDTTDQPPVVMTSSELGRLLDAVASELRDGPVPSGASLDADVVSGVFVLPNDALADVAAPR